ncbi:hypothetical protein RIF29_34155 [Crotalaria pallida]|uniref:Uncharacterized protein n=1 Tax=Crotalaria pallida TaxID=3830 RepID=A0AAN9E954_CROPI
MGPTEASMGPPTAFVGPLATSVGPLEASMGPHAPNMGPAEDNMNTMVDANMANEAAQTQTPNVSQTSQALTVADTSQVAPTDHVEASNVKTRRVTRGIQSSDAWTPTKGKADASETTRTTRLKTPTKGKVDASETPRLSKQVLDMVKALSNTCEYMNIARNAASERENALAKGSANTKQSVTKKPKRD